MLIDNLAADRFRLPNLCEEAMEPKTSKNSNVHLLYLAGILGALLVGSVSVNWNGIKDLPGIISFALGLSSLILALIAIFQSLSSNQTTTTCLVEINEAARLIAPAAKSISETSVDLIDRLNAMINEYQHGNLKITQLGDKLDKMNSTKRDTATGHPLSSKAIPGSLTRGAAPALLSAVLSYKKQKSFSFRKILTKDSEYGLAYKDGVIGGLLAAGIIERDLTTDTGFLITKITLDIDAIIKIFNSPLVKSGSDNEVAEIDQVKSFFGED